MTGSIPDPTPEMVLLVSMLRTAAPGRCSKSMARLRKRVGASNPKVEILRSVMPSLMEAKAQADTVLRLVCATCSLREVCPAPLA